MSSPGSGNLLGPTVDFIYPSKRNPLRMAIYPFGHLLHEITGLPSWLIIMLVNSPSDLQRCSQGTPGMKGGMESDIRKSHLDD